MTSMAIRQAVIDDRLALKLSHVALGVKYDIASDTVRGILRGAGVEYLTPGKPRLHHGTNVRRSTNGTFRVDFKNPATKRRIRKNGFLTPQDAEKWIAAYTKGLTS